MGLTASIYRDVEWERRGIDCTADGISSRFERVTITNAEGPFEPRPDAPGVKIVPGHMKGTAHAVPDCPEVEPRSGERGMMGGNYLASSDSRFSKLVESICGNRVYGAIPIHDRYE